MLRQILQASSSLLETLLQDEDRVEKAQEAEPQREGENDDVAVYPAANLHSDDVSQAEDAGEDGHPPGPVLGGGGVRYVGVEADVEAHVATGQARYS